MVILAGLHQQVGSRNPLMVHHDWSTNVLGLRFRNRQTLGGVYVRQKLEERERAEQLRLFYVAMTRARRRVTLFSAAPKRLRQNTFLALVLRGLDVDLDTLTQNCSLPVGSEEVPVSVLAVDEDDRRPVIHRTLEKPLTEVAVDVDQFVETWNERARRWDAIKEVRVVESPTRYASRVSATFSKRDQRSAEEALSLERHARNKPGRDGEWARLIGIMAHRLLAECDFQAAPHALVARIETTCSRAVPSEWRSALPDLVEELTGIIRTFIDSEAYMLLRRATILGREVPFSMPWQAGVSLEADDHRSVVTKRSTDASPALQKPAAEAQGPLIVEGVIDVMYRMDGDLWVGEYKTDQIEEGQVMERINRYRPQLAMYQQAVRRGLGVDHVGAHLFFLRIGQTFEL